MITQSKIDLEVLKIIEKIKKRMTTLGHPPITQLTAAQGRFFFQEAIKLYDLRLEVGVKFENQLIKRPHSPAIPIRIYRPICDKGVDLSLPILVYFQGGGWVFGSLDSADDTCSFLAKYGQCIVISVDYRRSPEHKYPAAVHDALDAIYWADQQAASLGGDRQRLALGGESAGGNLAAVAAIQLRNERKISPIAQLLITPVTQYGFETNSYQAGHQLGLSKETMAWFWQQYLEDFSQAEAWQVSPLRVKDASQLPPAIIAVAEQDPLLDDGLMYGDRLRSFGVPVKILRYPTLIHSFIRSIHVVQAAKVACHEIANSLKTQFYGLN
ncbi:alpha/beta hydrolase (plasmid) [Picosynechococcus sp. PCC 11901]|uniref:alpha/beta hydrolase n=1 Tax=Picosynechococcus sp. PCC 11901 TaxID=2579791 RepID=UPI0010FC26D5|nr:alpha/beta hydrolase [Picosynechococcus sp. PCC 11901]QCS51052.1 alpha/beta hydrolase [Picosynechococcus sp. PCC 11901]